MDGTLVVERALLDRLPVDIRLYVSRAGNCMRGQDGTVSSTGPLAWLTLRSWPSSAANTVYAAIHTAAGSDDSDWLIPYILAAFWYPVHYNAPIEDGHYSVQMQLMLRDVVMLCGAATTAAVLTAFRITAHEFRMPTPLTKPILITELLGIAVRADNAGATSALLDAVPVEHRGVFMATEGTTFTASNPEDLLNRYIYRSDTLNVVNMLLDRGLLTLDRVVADVKQTHEQRPSAEAMVFVLNALADAAGQAEDDDGVVFGPRATEFLKAVFDVAFVRTDDAVNLCTTLPALMRYVPDTAAFVTVSHVRHAIDFRDADAVDTFVRALVACGHPATDVDIDVNQQHAATVSVLRVLVSHGVPLHSSTTQLLRACDMMWQCTTVAAVRRVIHKHVRPIQDVLPLILTQDNRVIANGLLIETVRSRVCRCVAALPYDFIRTGPLPVGATARAWDAKTRLELAIKLGDVHEAVRLVKECGARPSSRHRGHMGTCVADRDIYTVSRIIRALADAGAADNLISAARMRTAMFGFVVIDITHYPDPLPMGAYKSLWAARSDMDDDDVEDMYFQAYTTPTHCTCHFRMALQAARAACDAEAECAILGLYREYVIVWPAEVV